MIGAIRTRRNKRIFWRIIMVVMGLSAVMLFALGVHGAAAQQNGVRLQAQAGLDGFCRDGEWIPVRVIVENQGTDLEARLEVSAPAQGSQQPVYVQEVSLPGVSRKELFIYVRFEGFFNRLLVRLVRGDEELASQQLRPECVSAGDRLYGVVSASSTPFGVLNDVNPPNGRSRLARLDIEDLPDRSAGLAAMDVLIFDDVDTGSLAVEGRQALESWIAGGGTIIVGGGPGWSQTTAALGNILPLDPEGTQTIPGLPAVAEFVGQDEALEGPVAVAAGIVNAGAAVLAEQDGLPLVLIRRIGYGRVFFLAFDPALSPFRDWDTQQEFYSRLLKGETVTPAWAGEMRSWSAASDAVASLEGLQLPSPLTVIGFLALYLAAIGPVQFIGLRLIKRRELAWLITPVLVLIFGLLAFTIGGLARGGRPVLSRLTLVQTWPGVEQARARGLVGVYSPERASYTLEVPPEFLVDMVDGNASVFALNGAESIRTLGDTTRVTDLRLDVGGLSAFAVNGEVRAPDLSADLSLQIDGSRFSLRGEIANHSDFTLEEAVLLAPGHSQRLGDLAAGETRPVQMALGIRPAAIFSPNITNGAQVFPSYNRSTSLETAILGGSDFRRDIEVFRRYSLLSAYTPPGSPSGEPDDGIYLFGWRSESPVDARLVGRSFSTQDTSLYVTAFRPEVVSGGNRITIPPGLFYWSPISSSSGYYNASPYNTVLYSQDEYSLLFRSSELIPFSAVENLTLHLERNGAGQPPEVRLWDFQAGVWANQEDISWGSRSIAHPDRYVGPGGEIRMVLANPTSTDINLQRADFTLTVEP